MDLNLISCGLGLFALIAIGVQSGWFDGIDRALLLWLRRAGDPATPIGWQGFEGMARDATSLGSFTVLTIAVLAVAGLMALVGREKRALALLFYTGCGALAGEAAKHVFLRARPQVVPHLVDVVTYSFPSAHAMQSASIWFILAMFLAKEQSQRSARIYIFSVAALLAFVVSFTRLYLGVHWPSDVAAGWALAAAWVGLCRLIDRMAGSDGA